MPEGTVKLVDKKNGCVGCIEDNANRVVHVFRYAGVTPGYQPKLGDRVTFRAQASPRSGQPEAIQIQLLVAA